jgi:hypothetical protein
MLVITFTLAAFSRAASAMRAGDDSVTAISRVEKPPLPG